MPNWFEKLPTAAELLEAAPLRTLLDTAGRQRVISETARFLDRLRTEAQAAAERILPVSSQELAQRVARWIATSAGPAPCEFINATGTFFSPEFPHGPQSSAALDAAAQAGRGWPAISGWLDTLRPLVQRQTGAEQVLVLQSASAALAAASGALAGGKALVLSRGEVEHDPLEPNIAQLATLSGAALVEVGTVNCTSVADYEPPLASAGLLLVMMPRWSHTTATVQRPTLEQLASAAQARQVPLLFDAGWGGFASVSPAQGPRFLTPREAFAAGADLVLLRGHGLFGGPPCGLLCGRESLVQRIAEHPLARLSVAQPGTLSALAATFTLYEQQNSLELSLPLPSLLSTSEGNLQQRAERLAPQVAALPGVASATAVCTRTLLHVGQNPEQGLVSWGVRIQPANGSADELALRLRRGSPSVLGTVANEAVELQLRTVSPREDLLLMEALQSLFPPVANP